uniref:Cell division cycle protein 16 homolog n=1 Tax=Diabrotica virgifera virgifera TaxID=50390 RepID=A0A6P7GWK2_DIAVI
TNLQCTYLTARCLYEANELAEALKVINNIENINFVPKNIFSPLFSNSQSLLFENTPKNQAYSSFLLLKGKILEGMDNRGPAADCYKQALNIDVHCFEAFDSLIKYQMLTSLEEEELLKSLPISEQCSPEAAEILYILYQSKLKKYHIPTSLRPMGSKIIYGSTPGPQEKSTDLLNVTPGIHSGIVSTPTIKVTPNVIRNNDRNLKKSEPDKIKSDEEHMQTEDLDNSILLKLKNSLDLQVAEAERLYYNCNYQLCSSMTEAILKVDPYHDACLPIHISCQVELKQSNILGKSDFARRYLAKATCLDRLFGPGWLAYGHSFAIENEHDQAMAAYFKASQLMKGCHLPLLYIGLECGLTNNVRLADKFFHQAQTIAPDDPFIMHEKGVIAFQNLDYESAESHFKTALDWVKGIRKGIIPQRWSPLLNNLGHTLRKMKQYKEALEYHNQALLLTPQSASTYSAIAYVHVLMENYEQAVEWFHKALGLKRDDAFSTTMLNYVIDQLSDEKPPYPGKIYKRCPRRVATLSFQYKNQYVVPSKGVKNKSIYFFWPNRRPECDVTANCGYIQCYDHFPNKECKHVEK